MTTETKNKRGRPSIMPDEYFRGLADIWSDHVETRRGLLNKHYEQIAFRVIHDMQKEGVTGLEYIMDNGRQKYKPGILRELGRFDKETIRAFAVELCRAQERPETKRTVREWGFLLRTYRLHPEVFDLISETVSENDDKQSSGED